MSGHLKWKHDMSNSSCDVKMSLCSIFLFLGSSPCLGPLQPVSLPCRLFYSPFLPTTSTLLSLPSWWSGENTALGWDTISPPKWWKLCYWGTKILTVSHLLDYTRFLCMSHLCRRASSCFYFQPFFFLLFMQFFPAWNLCLLFGYSICLLYFVSLCLQSFNQKLNFKLGYNSYMLKCTNVMCSAYSDFEKWLHPVTHTSIQNKGFPATSFVHWGVLTDGLGCISVFLSAVWTSQSHLPQQLWFL